jgi:diguanylate cyclase (GGDEF)-like protein
MPDTDPTQKIEALLLELDVYARKGKWEQAGRSLAQLRHQANLLAARNDELSNESRNLRKELQKLSAMKDRLDKSLKKTVKDYKESIDTFYRIKRDIEIVQRMRSMRELPEILDQVRECLEVEELALLLEKERFQAYVPKGVTTIPERELLEVSDFLQLEQGSPAPFLGMTRELPHIAEFLKGVQTSHRDGLLEGSCFVYPLIDKYQPEKMIGLLTLFDFDSQRYSPDKATDFLEHFGYILGCTLISVWEHQRLDREKVIDGLTGAFNREYLRRHAPRILDFAQRKHFPVTLLFIDLDGFKAVNDTLGHKAGDALLKTVVKAVKAIIRRYDIFVRMGGDEFVILLPDTDHANGTAFGERVFRAISDISVQECTAQKTELEVSASIGVAELEAGESLQDLIKRADSRMYEVKRARK